MQDIIWEVVSHQDHKPRGLLAVLRSLHDGGWLRRAGGGGGSGVVGMWQTDCGVGECREGRGGGQNNNELFSQSEIV